MWGSLLYYPLLTLLIVGLVAIALGVVWGVLVQFEQLDTFSLLSFITICVPGMPFILYRVSPRQRPGALMVLGGVVTVVAVAYPLELVEAQRSKTDQQQVEPRTQAALPSGQAQALAVPPPNAPAPPPAVVAAPLPEMGGKPADLSTVMGRARALANRWQSEASLVGLKRPRSSAA